MSEPTFQQPSQCIRIGLISDIHGNNEALEYALARLQGVDYLICMGDSVNEFGFNNQVIATLRQHIDFIVLGNHDLQCLESLERNKELLAKVDFELVRWFKRQPKQVKTAISGFNFLITHATSDPARFDYIYPHSRDFHQFARSDIDIHLYGHTHVAVAQSVNSTLIINPGSLGEGGIVGNEFKQSFAVLTLPEKHVEIFYF